MLLSPLAQKLFEQIEQIPVIDAHEHLPPEPDRVSKPVDVFTLFSHYTQCDLSVAGMPDPGTILRHELPLEVRWQAFEPYWKQIRHGGYARAALLAAKRFYGFDDINEQTYRPLSEAIAAGNTPGIYRRVLREVCGIKVALTQQAPRWDPDGMEPALLTPVSWLTIETTERQKALQPTALGAETTISTLEGYVAVIRDFMEKRKVEGAVGVKFFAHPFGEPVIHKAADALWKYRCGEIEALPEINPLYDYLMDAAVGLAGEIGLVVAVHTGYWGDFRQLDPLHLIPMIMRHPQTRFDIYHLGYPWIRETLMLGKGFHPCGQDCCDILTRHRQMPVDFLHR